jgi:deazaflavin-dependent oxidoreductase (nitroreductase family)
VIGMIVVGGGGLRRDRGLTKRIAGLLTRGGVHPRTVRAASRVHLWLYRRFGGTGFLGTDTLVLTTTGLRSGRPRSTPVYFVARGDRLYIAASFAGRDTPPQWYLNLLADPRVTVQTADRHGPYLALVLPRARADQVWPLLVAAYRPFARYQQRTTRTIPVIELTPATPSTAASTNPTTATGDG